MSELASFLKEQENAPLAAGDVTKFRHKSPEGGRDTIGYGHKLTKAEEKSGMVHGFRLQNLQQLPAEAVMQVADAILAADIKHARTTLNKTLKKEHGVSLSSLSPRKQMMLLDYEFNLGSAVEKFPDFTGAVIRGDEAKQKDEMTRHFTDPQGTVRSLARNGAFYNTFMSNAAKERLGE